MSRRRFVAAVTAGGTLAGAAVVGVVTKQTPGGRLSASDVLNPLDHGAAGDGTTDDRAAIQALLDSAPPGATVLIPGGRTFALSGGLVCEQTVNLCGGGTIAVVGGLDEDGMPAGLTLRGQGSTVQGVVLSNPGELTGRPGLTTGGYNVGILIEAHDVLVSECTIDRFQGGIVVAADGEWQRIRILGNRIEDVLGRGLGPTDVTSPDGEDGGDGICVWGSQATVTGNVVNAKAGRDARIGIHFEALPDRQRKVPATGHADEQISVCGNVVYGQFRRGIVVEQATGATVNGNCVADATWWSIALINTRNCTVSANAIAWTRTAEDNQGESWSPRRAALTCYGEVSDCVLSDNTVHATATSAARCFVNIQSDDGVPSDLLISGNVFGGDPSAAIQDALLTGPRTLRPRILGNRFSVFTERGLNLYGADRFEVANNSIDGNDGSPGRGIEADGAGAGLISNNVVSNVTQAIVVSNSSGVLVVGNLVTDCQDGFDGYASAGLLVSSNAFRVLGAKTLNIDDGANGNVVASNG
ncbi:right-handed parallel beta-helix repeat-containing protein [Geodermatophilus normandii]|nr:right-handed parallel beta-helix repeat-containing protein [Geodermatophilus normandii]